MSTSPGLLTQLETLIAQSETGLGTTGVGASQNNPGGLNYANWESAFGASGTPGSSATFPDLTSGYAALQQWISTHIASGQSLSQMMETYAPTASNPTTPARIQQYAAATGLDPIVPINQQNTGGTASTASGAASASSSPSWMQSVQNAATTAVTGAVTTAVTGAITNAVSSTAGLWVRVTTFLAGTAMFVLGLALLAGENIVKDVVGSKAKSAVRSVAKSAVGSAAEA
jgi:hypothetical protein